MNHSRRTGFASLALAGALSIAGCGGAAISSPPVATTTPEPSASAARTSPPATPRPSAAPTPAGTAFSTRYFTPALDLIVPPYLKTAPEEESSHFVTFFAADGTRAIRIMGPVAVYPPGATKATAVPTDYAAYLDRLAAAGVHVTDRAATTVDGHRAVVVTAASSTSMDGSIGCPAANLPAANCFGVGEDVILRLAAIETDAGPLLMWLRLRAADNPDTALAVTDFAAFLEGVRFADRKAQPEPTPAYAGLDGTYTWTITLADAKADPNPQKPEDVPTYPWVFTMALSGGVVKVRVEFAVGDPQEGSGTYEAAPGRLTLHFGGIAQVYAVKQDKDGTLHLTAIDVRDPGDKFVNTIKPWKKVP